MSMSRAEKERLLRALEEDKEFRYAVMGLLGFKEILERFARLEERFAKLQERVLKLEERVTKLEKRVIRLEERFARLEERVLKLEKRVAKLEERILKLEERFAKLEERVTKLEERFAKLEERQQKLEERFARLEERFVRLEERQQKLEERFLRLEEEMRNTKRVIAVIAHRFGVLSEKGLRETLKYVVEEVLGVSVVERREIWDSEGIVYGHPSMVEIDVVVRDGDHILIEFKSRVSRGDVAELYRVGLLYEKTQKVKPKLLIVGGFIDKAALESAAKLNIDIRPVVEE